MSARVEQAGRVVQAYLAGADPRTWRDDLRMVWLGGNAEVWQAAAAAGVSMVAMLKAAAFPISQQLPHSFPAWRAVAEGGMEWALGGLSWTRHRMLAHALAGAYVTANTSAPIVVVRTVRREQLVFHHRGPSGAEEVVFEAPPEGRIDANERTWLLALHAWNNGPAKRRRR